LSPRGFRELRKGFPDTARAPRHHSTGQVAGVARRFRWFCGEIKRSFDFEKALHSDLLCLLFNVDDL
jgi:hypothetical protein